MKLISIISYEIQHASCQLCKAIHKSTHVIVQGCIQRYKNIRRASHFEIHENLRAICRMEFLTSCKTREKV
jgi:hypothetical protein